MNKQELMVICKPVQDVVDEALRNIKKRKEVKYGKQQRRKQ